VSLNRAQRPIWESECTVVHSDVFKQARAYSEELFPVTIQKDTYE
jgi:hypothetical protein